ncbi:MAG: hypothetical protein ABH863_04070, partial [Candidatus Micrarchaeota archaeon]
MPKKEAVAYQKRLLELLAENGDNHGGEIERKGTVVSLTFNPFHDEKMDAKTDMLLAKAREEAERVGGK